MAKHRDIIVRLTEPQYDALNAAIALAENEWDQDGTGPTPQSVAVLNRAWDAVRTAWHRAGMGF